MASPPTVALSMRWIRVAPPAAADGTAARARALLKEITGAERLEFAAVRARVELGGVPAGVANALRRSFADEAPGYALRYGGASRVAGTTDPHVSDLQLRLQIEGIALEPHRAARALAAGARFELRADNPTEPYLAVYSRDLVPTPALPAPLFAPTYPLVHLSRGHALRVDTVDIVRERARRVSACHVAVQVAGVPLDVPRAPPAETHPVGAPGADVSGYAVSSLVARPRRHAVTATFPCVVDAPSGLEDVRRTIAGVLRDLAGRAAALRSAFQKTPALPADPLTLLSAPPSLAVADGEATLVAPGETVTLGLVLQQLVYDEMPAIEYCAPHVLTHREELVVTIRCAEPRAALQRAVEAAAALFERLALGVEGARITTLEREVRPRFDAPHPSYVAAEAAAAAASVATDADPTLKAAPEAPGVAK
jgi:DNA-directed RNA polymerase subunit L